MKLASGGLSWVAFFSVLALVFIVLVILFEGILRFGFLFLSIVLVLLSVVLLIFFRDPERAIGAGVVAPADGVVREISKVHDGDVGECIRVSIFMNMHNVHVNRMPLEGVVQNIVHYNGSHIPAFRKESERNERVIILFKTHIGIVKLVQIAGTVARRIISYVNQGDMVKKGERIGLIRLGSRVDLYLPEKTMQSIRVQVKDRIKAGVNTIAEIHG
jgi:phosphatidylserine decarboxylase